MVAPIIGRGPDVATGRALMNSAEASPAGRVDVKSRVGEQVSIRTPADAMNVLRTRMEQRLQDAMGGMQNNVASGAAKYAEQSQPPSASDVASTILGFVESRLQKEAEEGADPEKLADLMAQAREGINQGYAEAREQITALGMMNETLSGEIEKGFDLIQEGLLNLEEKLLGEQPETGESTGLE
ncbi:DUF5610 domain-containing protein [Marinobacter adhaerens]|uniref:DUF5610 domain-containing protein n=1 Tax=Marinobacter adhaerens TaxID=1033846 RepID=A0A851HQ50_9GAMM|nr:DUF5610 domain-containing protein [Marinobacter adhaerens]NWN91584.1 DUF5610 domain-containing protein [Marinobacter adhaerens]